MSNQADDLLRFFGVSEDDLCTESGLHLVSNKLRVAGSNLSASLGLGAEELEQSLRQLHGNPWFVGVDMKFKARLVSNHMRHQSALAHELAVSGTRMWHSFRNHILGQRTTVKKQSRNAFKLADDAKAV